MDTDKKGQHEYAQTVADVAQAILLAGGLLTDKKN